jgi:hypothetical protein
MGKRIFAPSYGPSVPARWGYLTGDIDWQAHGGTWFRHVPGTRVYYALVFFDWRDATGDESQPHYNAYVRRVDLDDCADQMERALACCGWTEADATEADVADLLRLDAALAYGLGAPMGDYYGNHPIHVRAEARRAAEAYMADADAEEDALDRPANRLGDSARDLGAGRSWLTRDRGEGR